MSVLSTSGMSLFVVIVNALVLLGLYLGTNLFGNNPPIPPITPKYLTIDDLANQKVKVWALDSTGNKSISVSHMSNDNGTGLVLNNNGNNEPGRNYFILEKI